MFVTTLAVLTAISFGATYSIVRLFFFAFESVSDKKQCGGNATASKGHSAATCNRISSVAAALEWAVSFIVVFYFLTLAADLWPAGKSSPRYIRRLARWQVAHGEGHNATGRPPLQDYYKQQGRDEAVANREQQMRTAMWERNAGVPATQGYPTSAWAGNDDASDYNGQTWGHQNGYIAEGRDSTASGAPMMRQVPEQA